MNESRMWVNERQVAINLPRESIRNPNSGTGFILYDGKRMNVLEQGDNWIIS
jgi:hypothetical protein